MEKVIIIDNRDQTIALGKQIGKLLQPHMLMTLNGDLGAGKTTFTKGIGKGLGVKKIINSPTFTIVKEYQGRWPLYHFDAYRLEGENEELGFEEMFENDGVCVIEWPMYIQDILPQAITIKRIDDSKREFILNPIGKRYEELVEEIDYENNCHG